LLTCLSLPLSLSAPGGGARKERPATDADAGTDWCGTNSKILVTLLILLIIGGSPASPVYRGSTASPVNKGSTVSLETQNDYLLYMRDVGTMPVL